ncbi:hypothetical protein Dimus_030765, partial [Dionaea muscipula]
MKSPQPTRGERRGGTWRDEQGERRGVRCRRRSNIEADEIRLNHTKFKPGTAGGGVGGDLPAVRGSFEGVVFRVAEEGSTREGEERNIGVQPLPLCSEMLVEAVVVVPAGDDLALIDDLHEKSPAFILCT